jgi:preprotein translocase subunit YajC
VPAPEEVILLAILVPLAQSSSGSGTLGFLLPLVLMGGIFYLLLIRPQQRNRRRQAQLLSGLEEGDEVQTIGGIFGTIREIDADTVLLEVAPEVEMRFIRGAIARKLIYDEDADEGQEQDQDAEQEEGAGEQK